MQLAAKKLLFIFRTASYSHTQEGLDVLLMASSFNQTVSVFFLDDGVLTLKTQQNATLIHYKNFWKTFQALPLYDVEKIYTDKNSLSSRNIQTNELCIPVTILNDEQIKTLVKTQDIILNF